MPKRSSSSDLNQNAARIVAIATGEKPKKVAKVLKRVEKKKNRAAVALGRLGGKKGGPARAKALTAEERREIAVRAARARWGTLEPE